MRIRAANPKGTNPGAPRRCATRPRLQGLIDVKRTVGKINAWIGGRIVQRRGELAMLERLHGFNQPRHPSRGVSMADVALDRADGTELFCVRGAAEDFGQRGDLNW